MRSNVSPVKYELGFYIPEDGILHSDRRENLKTYTFRSYLRSEAFTANESNVKGPSAVSVLTKHSRLRRPGVDNGQEEDPQNVTF
jgi:hypothetical protein